MTTDELVTLLAKDPEPAPPPSVFSNDFDCQTCGACCVEAGYVAVYPDENVPAEMQSLRDRDKKYYPDLDMRELVRHCHGRCKSLKGIVGTRVSCGIYEDRPRVCQSFEPGGEDCRHARREADCCIRSGNWERRGYGDSWRENNA